MKKVKIYVGKKFIGYGSFFSVGDWIADGWKCPDCSKIIKSNDHVCITDYEIKRTLKNVN